MKASIHKTINIQFVLDKAQSLTVSTNWEVPKALLKSRGLKSKFNKDTGLWEISKSNKSYKIGGKT